MNEDRFDTAVRQAIAAQVGIIVDEEAEAACRRVRERVRGVIANVVVSVSQHYSIERFGTDLRITVHDKVTGDG